MVGHAFCEKLVKRIDASACRIVVFGEESHPAYDRVNLSQYFAGKDRGALQFQPHRWYQERGIDLRTGQRVTRIDRQNNRVFCGEDDSIHYDKLILATGSRPFVPPIDGINGDGVFVYRTLEDLEAIKKYSQTVRSAAVLGGGLLGLEAAQALLNLNLETHVVEVAPGLMPRQLDTEGAALLQAKVESLGIQVHTLKRTSEVVADNDKKLLKFEGGKELSVGMIVVSAGIRPNDELAKVCGLSIGKRGGVVVDNQLKTSDENIFAIGECASHDETVYGLVGPGYQMADVLSEFLADQITENVPKSRKSLPAFTGGDQSARLKLLGVDVTTLGSPIGEVPFATTVSTTVAERLAESDNRAGGVDDSIEPADKVYRKLILHKRQLVGAMAVGPWSEIDRIQQAIAAGRRVWPWNETRFARTGRLWKMPQTQSVVDWPEGAIVCSCLKISRGTLTAAENSGCNTIEQLACQTGASTVCGSCRPLLANLLDAPADAAPQNAVKGHPGLSIAALFGAALLACWLVIGKLPFAESVTSVAHQIDFIWRDNFYKQVTGYTLLGFAALGLLLPLRKRLKRFSFGSYGLWRTMHASIGSLTLVGLIVHTGMHLGENLNLLLAIVFLGINLMGVAVAIVTSMETKATGSMLIQVRKWRPRIATLHLWLLWPLPALLAIHIFCVYFY